MNSVKEIMKAICIALAVANFLLKTGRALKAVELCKESLVLLKTKALSLEKQLGQLIYQQFYATMLNAYSRIRDNTDAITYGRKLLAIHRERGDSAQEGMVSITLARTYLSQSKYVEAKELCERAIPLMKKLLTKDKKQLLMEK